MLEETKGKAAIFFPASVKKAIKNYDEKLFLFSHFFSFRDNPIKEILFLKKVKLECLDGELSQFWLIYGIVMILIKVVLD